MKRMHLLFPLLFLIALGGSAFSRYSHSEKTGTINAWYYDPNWNTCDGIQLDDDKCVVDPVGNQCQEFIGGLGFTDMWQSVFGNTCYLPYYQYN
jgi:hypothetical protein